jgi:hypothetical protein
MQRRERRTTAVRFLTACGLCLAMGWTAMGAEPAGIAAPLFNGKDFTGWKVIGCEAVVQDGAIFLSGGNGLVQTERQYADFVLEWDCKALKPDNWDSGVYFRYDSVPPGRPWPKQHQVNLRKGMEGDVAELNAKSTGLTKPGQWNHYKLTVQGTRASLEINGQAAWKTDGLTVPKGYIGIQAEVPQGGQFLFREIRLSEK